MVLRPSFPEVKVDIDKIEQVVKCYLSNTYKYSPEHDEVTLWTTEVLHDQQRKVLITIEDQGLGMTPEQLERVFEKLYRADHRGLDIAIIKSNMVALW
ncbi:MAG: ATP-binding protein [Methylotenera sp.]|nr:ATP-binding protein [Methylotenera sp.]MSQ00202.1 ATP-binding protein [Methylotenera sp.]